MVVYELVQQHQFILMAMLHLLDLQLLMVVYRLAQQYQSILTAILQLQV